MKKRFVGFLFMLFFSLFITTNVSAETTIEQYAKDMQPGWNLGNTYDAVVGEVTDETAWGNPRVTEQLIQAISEDGYNSIRIPITFDGRMKDGVIDKDYLNRIKQTVDWSLESDLKVMINIHHDSWLWLSDGMMNNHDETVTRFQLIWEQLSDTFKDYPQDVSFESLNEPQFTVDYSQSDADQKQQAQNYLDELNTLFMEIVRGSGGNNTTRPVVIPTMHTSSEEPHVSRLKSWIEEMNDPNIIATVHYYSYWPFSVNIAGATTFNEEAKQHIHTELGRVYDTFTKSGIPVVVGEFGLLGFDQHTGTIQQGEKLKFFEYVIHYMSEHDLAHMLWDNGQHINRHDYTWYDNEFEAINKASFYTRSATAEADYLYFKQDETVTKRSLGLQLNGRTLSRIHYNDTIVSNMDYHLTDETITFTDDFLQSVVDASAIGTKGVITLSFDDGADWTIDLRVYDTPTVGTNSDDYQTFTLPVDYNGDQLMTLETVYPDGSGAGPQNWTTFKEFSYVFSPDYDNNQLVFTYNEWDGHSRLFDDIDDNRPVTLKLHFLSGEVIEQTIIKKGDTVSTYTIDDYANTMQPGWNLGNTYDAVAGEVTDETAWGNPRVTEELIQFVSEAGYKSIRIPITFDGRLTDDDMIDPDYLARITQTVDWALMRDMKVMMNIHHDSWVWIENEMPQDPEATLKRFETIWQQLAEHFKDYPVDLSFESINEPRFNPEDDLAQGYLNQLNDAFMQIVRGSGGNNALRPVIIPTMHTAMDAHYLNATAEWIDAQHDDFIMATVHYYGFWPFSVNIAGYTTFEQDSKQHVEDYLGKTHDIFSAIDTPVVVGEFGLLGFDQHTGTIQQGEKLKFFEYVINYMNAHNLVHMLWDNGQHIDRNNYQWFDTELRDMLKASIAGRSATANQDYLYFDLNKDVTARTLALELNGRTLQRVVYNDTTLNDGDAFTLVDSTLTFTQSFLDSIVDRSTIGHQGTLTLQFDEGADWTVDLFVSGKVTLKNHTAPIKDFAIPVNYQGNQLITLEAFYSDGSGPAGPQNWTTFKEFGYVFSPDYEDDVLTLIYDEWNNISRLFNEVEANKEVTLRLHFLNGETIDYFVTHDGTTVTGETKEASPPVTDPDDPSTNPEEDEEDTNDDQTNTDDDSATVLDKQIEALKSNGTLTVTLTDTSSLVLSKEHVQKLQEKNAVIKVVTKDVTVSIHSKDLSGESVIAISKTTAFTPVYSDQAVSPIYTFSVTSSGKEVTAFDHPVTLAFNIDETETDALSIYYFNEETQTWEDVGGSYRDGYVITTVNHFSTFAVYNDATFTTGEDTSADDDDKTSTHPNDTNDTPSAENGDALPHTASHIFNLLVIGGLLIVMSIGYMLYKKRQTYHC
ncbi:hypothetical protein HMI01_12010 [Halolactibacillus miurensis]|uniref:Aryl-phospho-beta-D-glucosidase BglC, GH1 family n=1 Tax=Halolactibacillus miurensis TaxID=306541 RepID=A0A1I6SSV0_9BACI|nr:cellulase family glycosylhydrolase [Halolactibacillus miurensis]GEM04213.1 hypothetical protein HMI01_12010 [Halolactibacillus miurensis]SFS80002.1 Aryl-phospho-beta-D-glucosidase BglC, GH1 family [Halolactibacillus miurensis]